MDTAELNVLAAIGRGHLVYRPDRKGKKRDYVTSVGMVKVELDVVRKLHHDGLLEARPGYPGSFQLSAIGKEAVDGTAAYVS